MRNFILNKTSTITDLRRIKNAIISYCTLWTRWAVSHWQFELKKTPTKVYKMFHGWVQDVG